MAFGLSHLALAADTVLHLRHPVTDELLYEDEAQEVAVTIDLHGTASKQYRNALAAMQNRALRRQTSKEKPKAEDLIKEGVDLLVTCSSSSTLELEDGTSVDSADAFRTLYSDPQYSWVKDQVDAALANVGNFLQSAKP